VSDDEKRWRAGTVLFSGGVPLGAALDGGKQQGATRGVLALLGRMAGIRAGIA
jgi:hypothetical protein